MKIIAVALLFLWPTLTHAEPMGVMMHDSLIGYMGRVNSSTNQVSDRTVISNELGVGYILLNTIYLGGAFHYSVTNEAISDSSGQNMTHAFTNQYYGPSVGWINNNWLVTASYYLYAQEKDQVTPVTGSSYTHDRTGAGYSAMVSYRFNLGWVDLGPSIIYRALTYKDCKNPVTGATSSCNPQIEKSEVLPYLTLFFNLQ